MPIFCAFRPTARAVDPGLRDGFGKATETKDLSCPRRWRGLEHVLGDECWSRVCFWRLTARMVKLLTRFESGSILMIRASLPPAGGNKILGIVKNVTLTGRVYRGIFVYYIFSGVNFNLIPLPNPGRTPKQNSLAQLQQGNLSGYQHGLASLL